MPTLKCIYQLVFNYIRKSDRLEIYTDGSYKNGWGSWAFVVSRNGKCLKETSGRVRFAGGNEMEFQAAIEAISSIPLNSKVILYSDSRILIDAMKLSDGPNVYQTQIDILMHLKQKHKIQWQWIKAHSGNRFNERCDQLCILARSV